MAVGAALPPGVDWQIVDGNLPDADPLADIAALIEARRDTSDPVQVVAFTVMPGPQLVSAVPLTRDLKARYPDVPTVWGGNFPSLYPTPVLNAPYIDWAVRGQGEETFAELLEVLDGRRDAATVEGLCFRRVDGSHHVAMERTWKGPNELPDPPYHKIRIADYLHPTFLGRRSGVYQASIGCPYGCKLCGVISVYGSRERQQVPSRTAEHLRFLVESHGMDSVHFYDNNFFVKEEQARELAERIEPLGLRWWCEARVDALTRYSDDTWKLLKRSGLTMVFCGAESGSDAVLAKMNKGTTDGADSRGGAALAPARYHSGILIRFWRSRRSRTRDRQHPVVHPPAQVGESGDGADHLFLHAHAPAARHLRRRRRGERNAGAAGRLDGSRVGCLDDARRSDRSLARSTPQGEGRGF
jgi:hypothetical protein